MTKTRNLKLVSSKLKKFVFPYDSTDETKGPDWKVGDPIEGEYQYVEDPNQADRIGKTYKVSYVSYDGGITNKLHSIDDAAIQESTKGPKNKEYYINGIKHEKETWKELLDVSKMDPLLQTDKVFSK
jgi:hypothetical protein